MAAAAALPGEWPAQPWNFIGLAPLGLGLALAMAAERQFVRAGTPVRPFTQSVVLVSDGLFRRSRNPMYLGLILALVGAALLLSSPLALLAAPAYGWWVQRRFIAREERLLEERFGDAYRAYCRRVRRWV
ncbi:MAG TPA: methyltransferase [Burkholderiales bacterium]|nr:methyltransferase [Burkholderiales bacterium]